MPRDLVAFYASYVKAQLENSGCVFCYVGVANSESP